MLGKIRKYEFWSQIERLMAVKEINQKELSIGTGIAQSSITDWKKKGTTPRGVNLQKVADFFNVTTDELLYGHDYVQKNKESETRIEEAAEYSERYETRAEKQLAFELDLMRKHLKAAQERADIAEEKLGRVRKVLEE